MDAPSISVVQAADLFVGMRAAGVRCWVMGGWGVDALLRRETRPHHDVNLLVHFGDLWTMNEWLRGQELIRKYAWDESKPIHLEGQIWETAFVDAHQDGRELDVHGIEVDGEQRPLIATTDPWRLPQDTLTGVGAIAGREIACVSKAAQVTMHRGYELPSKHREDLVRLDQEPQAYTFPTYAVAPHLLLPGPIHPPASPSFRTVGGEDDPPSHAAYSARLSPA